LGLAKIRRGDLEGGRAEIEIAASLDPNTSLIRSYLGKAYFEEKRTNLDGPQYEIAKELDPNDPTPYFYDAIRKQTINRPVEALRDFEKSIELNDNRAVFRSKLKLDSDEAARSASLARIYSDLGFQELALVEGWKSVNTDPTNHSAHRFLADSYASRPRHEIARVSELLQSQLLQPTNVTPIQPRLAESNLFLISAQGPGSLSFNEFNPIFSRNGATAQFSVLAGENDTIGGEFVLSAIQNRLSWSLGYTLFDTDGWRENADQDDKIANAFLQYELSYKTSIQAEYRYRDNKRGDTQLRFFEDDFLPRLQQEDKSNFVRLGFRHTFSSSTLIGNFSYQDKDRSLKDTPDPVFVPLAKIDGDDEALGSDLQHLFRSEKINIISGLGYFDIDSKEKVTVEFQLFPGFIVTDSFNDDFDATHGNAYLYPYINLLENLTLTVGASYDDFDPDDEDIQKDRNQFNPKFGIVWNPFTGTTLRGAAFRVLKRTLITEQTVEPTQVAGFNQFFDENNGTDSWRYGGAIDQKFTENLYGGVEYTYRNMSVPFLSVEVDTVKWEDKTFRSYLFWTPHDWVALRAEYVWERLDRDEDFSEGAKEVKTHYVPLGINLFHPSGLSASLQGTYVNQDGEFARQGTPQVFEDGDDKFWLVDAAIKYRFPKRYGFVTVGVTNLFDEDFEHFDPDRNNPRVQPDRLFFVSATLALP
jgi:tetratricopeptide (TPR) repeat protein